MSNEPEETPQSPRNEPEARLALRRIREHAIDLFAGSGYQAPTDADKYRWIRANRGSFAILDALSTADRDADFDMKIEMAIQRTASGRRVGIDIGDLPR